MPLGIRIGEQSSLKDSIIGRPHSWHKVSRIECNLIRLSKVIADIPIEDDLSDLDEWIILLRDYFGRIEYVVLIVWGIFFRNGLDAEFPLSSLTSVDMLDQVSGGVIVIAEQGPGFLPGEVLDAC